MEYYVYLGVYNSVVMYVGKGSKQRIKHLNSGVSSCYYANKLHFSGDKLDVYEVAYFYKDVDAIAYEKELINSLLPAWNIMLNPDSDKSMFRGRREGQVSSSARLGKKPMIYTSKYLGVGFYKKGVGGKRTIRKHWRATYNQGDAKIHIGFYETELDAAIARDDFIIKNNINLPLNFG